MLDFFRFKKMNLKNPFIGDFLTTFFLTVITISNTIFFVGVGSAASRVHFSFVIRHINQFEPINRFLHFVLLNHEIFLLVWLFGFAPFLQWSLDSIPIKSSPQDADAFLQGWMGGEPACDAGDEERMGEGTGFGGVYARVVSEAFQGADHACGVARVLHRSRIGKEFAAARKCRLEDLPEHIPD